MSECVVRMEMPENCCECQLRQEDYEMGEEFCPFTGVECLSIGRQNNCPIICQLPEGHGRLIDWDAFERIGFKLCRKTSECRAELGAPTNESYVVPAERSET